MSPRLQKQQGAAKEKNLQYSVLSCYSGTETEICTLQGYNTIWYFCSSTDFIKVVQKQTNIKIVPGPQYIHFVYGKKKTDGNFSWRFCPAQNLKLN